jgi:hypothetical protein
MESILDYLLTPAPDSDLLNRYVFKIFPMGDPDGVARGGVRFNQFGHDLNRNWDLVKPEEMPEIFHQKKTIQDWLESGRPIHFFLTLHNTESSDYIQGPQLPAGQKVWESMVANSSFEAPEGLRSIQTQVEPGRMTVYENLWSEFGIPAYLMELKIEQVRKINRSRMISDWLSLGPKIIESISSALDSE